MRVDCSKIRVLLVAGMLSYDKPMRSTQILRRLETRGITCAMVKANLPEWCGTTIVTMAQLHKVVAV